jgi:predicted acyltransferase
VLLALRGLLRLAVARRLSLPLQAYGLNPLLLYVLAWLWAASYPLIRIGEDDLQTWLFTHMASALPPALASLLFALAHVLALGALALWLMRRRIVVRL